MIEILKEVVTTQLGPISSFDPADTLGSLGADTLDEIEILMEVEVRLGVSLDESEFSSTQTLQEWADKIQEKVNGKTP